ncbi:MAG: hypothetical protein GKC10_04595 [Methanosarcinales archaeon]|nr:hypothetical protein [Methanosarcinales archaeon]
MEQMNPENDLLKAIYDEVKAMREEISRLSERIGLLEVLILEELTDGVDDDELDEEIDLIAWNKLKEDLGL